MTREREIAGTGSAWLWWALKLSVAIIVLTCLLQTYSLRRVWSAITVADPMLLVVAMLPSVAAVFASALRLRVLAAGLGIKVNTSQIARINFVSSFYGLLLPGALAGGAVRWYQLSRVTGKGAESLVAVMLSRLGYTLMLLLLGLTALLLQKGPGKGGTLAILLTVAVMALIWLGYTLPGKPLQPKQTGGVRGPHRGVRFHARRVLVALGAARSLSRATVISALGASLLDVSLELLSTYLVAVSLGMSIGIVTISWVSCSVELATMLPLTLLGLGIREGGFVALLSPYDIPGSQALALSFLILGRTLVIGLIGAILECRRWFSAHDAIRDPKGSAP